MLPQSTKTLTVDERIALLGSIESVGPARPAITSDWAISYGRVSGSIQDTIPEQLECNRRNAERLQVVVKHELQDVESGLRADRAGYQELLRLAVTGQYGHLLLFKADRLSRDDGEFVTVCRPLLQMGMRLWDYTIGPITEHNVGFLALMAFTESRSIADRTQMKMEALAEKGKKFGMPRTGYMHGGPGKCACPTPCQYVPDPVLGPLVSELFQRYAEGEPLRALLRWWNHTTRRHGTVTGLKNLLKHEYYKGMTVGCKARWSRLDGHFARPREEWKVSFHNHPLVDEETWEQVQARLKVQASVGQERKVAARYNLTGIIWCGQCQRRMHGRTKRATSKQYLCEVCRITKGSVKIERSVLRLLGALPVAGEDVARLAATSVADQRDALGREVAGFDAQLAVLTAERIGLTRERARNEITPSDYHAAIAASDADRADLLARREQLERRIHDLPQESFLLDDLLQQMREVGTWTNLLKNVPVEQVQAIYRECCKRIVLEPGGKSVTVHWHDHIAAYMPASVHTTEL